MKNTVIFVLTLVVLALTVVVIIFYPLRMPQPTDTPAPPVVGAPYAPNDWKTWQDQEHTKSTGEYFAYSFNYPRDFDVRPGEQAAGGQIGETKVQVLFPDDAFKTPKSNFSEAFFTVSEATVTEAKCFTSPFETALTGEVLINGLAYKTGTSSDAGAGNLYTSRLYRTMFAKRCIEAALTVHTTNIGNYDPGMVVEFDKQKAFSVLSEILTTLKLTTSTSPALQ